MHTRNRWKRVLCHFLCVSVAAACIGAPAHAIEPATLAATAGTAIEVAGKVKAFLDFIENKNPHAVVEEKLDRILEGLEYLKDRADAHEAQLNDIADADVRKENEEGIQEFKAARLQVAVDAVIAVKNFRKTPQNEYLRTLADVASRKAMQLFEDGLAPTAKMFRLTGPGVNDLRFNHLLAYGGYLSAIPIRILFIQTAQRVDGSYRFTHKPYRTEFLETEAKLRWLLAQIEESLVGKYGYYWGYEPNNCTEAEIFFYDHILFDRVEAVKPENRDKHIIEIPDHTCDPNFVEPYLEELIRGLVAERAASYGSIEISAIADMVRNYALYGRPTPPQPPAFSAWDYMVPFNAYWVQQVTFAPEGDDVPGAPVRDLSVTNPQAWDEHLWRIPNANGLTPIFHEASGLCLTPTPEGRLTLEVCDGADDQLWSRGTPYALDPQDPNVLRHVVSGLCLSAAITSPGLFGNSLIPGLGLEFCENRPDQIWTRLNMSWSYGTPRSSSHHLGLAPAGEAVPGVSISLVDGASPASWRLSATHGLFGHEASMLCLTHQAGMEDLTLEDCTGASAQLWSKDIHGFIRHQSSGTCLSSVKVTVHDLGKFGQTISVFPLLHLAACENGRADQIWDGFSSYPGLH